MKTVCIFLFCLQIHNLISCLHLSVTLIKAKELHPTSCQTVVQEIKQYYFAVANEADHLFIINKENVTKDGPLCTNTLGHCISCNIVSISASCQLMHVLESKEMIKGSMVHAISSCLSITISFFILIISKRYTP